MKVYVMRVIAPDRLTRHLQEALEWTGWENIVPAGARVFIKPNLTWRVPTPGVTTTPQFIEAVVTVFRERTHRIVIGEADGGYHSFRAEEAFHSHGLYDLSRRYGIDVVNLSTQPVETRTVIVAGKPVTVELPQMLVSAVDVFVTLPVPKIHAMTGVSLGFKNQWGCQPGTMRLRNHPDFSRKILAINKVLNPRVAIFDGTYFLDRTGPMIGDPVRLDLLLVSDHVGAGSRVCCEIMGINPERIRHLRLAQQEGMMPATTADVEVNQPLAQFATHTFRLKRSLIQWIALGAFHSHLGTCLFYDSMVAGPLHKILYAIRKNWVVGRVLYGPAGPPRVEGRR